MARMALFAATAAGALMLSGLPFASATDVAPLQPAQQTQANQERPGALHANMLGMNMCGDRERLVQELESQFNESVTAVGQVDSNAIVEVFVSDSGSWTIIATGTDGMSCILSAGEGWESTVMVRGLDA
jgi:hypothetical protein